jgi:hypothetical protein
MGLTGVVSVSLQAKRSNLPRQLVPYLGGDCFALLAMTELVVEWICQSHFTSHAST